MKKEMPKIKEFLEAFMISEELTNSERYKIKTHFTNFYIYKREKFINNSITTIYNYLLIKYKNKSYLIYKFNYEKGKYKVSSKHKSEEELINTLTEIL